MEKHQAGFIVNNIPYECAIEADMTLATLLRDELGLTGTKTACGVGECGACTVLVDGKAVLSCCTLALSVRGKEITTIEGLSNGNKLHPIQQAFIDCGAIQCGYCTPGMVLTAKALLDENPRPTRQEVKEAIAGNLCRCTGYAKIIEAIMVAAERMSNGGNKQ